ncbi:tetratricopeptide repeat protein [Streptomyces canus]|uniref:tetratricopeptide repeat protein n=1 Tax=Streptomyces canus TaxID=58343 RepID=UPI002E252C79
MANDRLVRIFVGVPGPDPRSFGSGYLIAPRLALTAAHVLGEGDRGAATVSLALADGPKYPATVRWHLLDETIDAALVEIAEGNGWQPPESLSDPSVRPPQRFGLVIGARPCSVILAGFPRMQRDPDGRRLDEQLNGSITPGKGSLAGHYEVSSTDPLLPVDRAALANGSRWSGISGAAVLYDGGGSGHLLCGVVGRDRRAEGGTRLTATPSDRLLADDDFRLVATEHTGWEPLLEPAEAATLFTPAASTRHLKSPASLLRADAEAVAFHGRDRELSRLLTWCQDGPSAMSVEVLTGPGGQGKSRLARRLTELLRRRGWVTGHLRSDLTDRGVPDFTALATALPLLIVVDYAETRPHLVRRLISDLHPSRHRVRLLVVARSDGPWRSDSLSEEPDVRQELIHTPGIELTALIPRSRPVAERHSAFLRAAHDLARLLPRIPTLPEHDWAGLAGELQPPDDLAHPRYDNALTLQTTALVALLQLGPRPADVPPGTPPEAVLLLHEKRFWKDSAETPAFELRLSTRALEAVVAVVVLCGAADEDEAAKVIGVLRDVPDCKIMDTVAWLAGLYPPEPSRYWGSLQPDRIAEYQASSALLRGYVPLPALFEKSAPAQQAQIIVVLTRAAIAHYNSGRAEESRQVLSALDSALDSAHLTYEAAYGAVTALPLSSRVIAPLALRLRRGLAKADRVLADEYPAVHEPVLATSLDNLGTQLGHAGHRAEALAVIEEAIAIRRRHVADGTDGEEHRLAVSLSNYGSQLSELGRRKEALAATAEASAVWRRLAQASPLHEPDLARSLSHLGIRLTETGRLAEGLALAQEGVRIWRRLAAADPTAFTSDLAGALSNLGIRFSDTMRLDEALAATEESVRLLRPLAAHDPDAFESQFAGSLSNLGVDLKNLGRWREALAAEEEAVEIRRRLVAENPAAHEPDLARSLSNLDEQLAQVGRVQEALAVEEEAVDILRRLARHDFTAYGPGLASGLHRLGVRLSGVGLAEEALRRAEEALVIWCRLATDNPVVFRHEVARSLSAVGGHLVNVGRAEKALDLTEQSVAVWRPLAADNRAFEPDLAATLTNLGTQRAEVFGAGEGRTATEEAVAIWRRLASEYPATYEPDLARALSNLALDLSQAEREGVAFACEWEAAEVGHRLAAADPTAFAYDPTRSRRLRAELMTLDVDELGDALRTTGEIVEFYRVRVSGNPVVLMCLHTVLGLQEILLRRLGREEEADRIRRWLRENPLAS